MPERDERRRFAVALVLLLALLPGCSSPDRGRWRGTFTGDVEGTMEFDVNARGTKAKGEITGATLAGEKFEAEFEGTLNQGFLNARFEGSSQTGMGVPAGFRGEIQGDLESGSATGSWKVDLILVRAHYEGKWTATQVSE